MDKEKVKKILEKIKETVGENNYKLALAITGHRPGKIKDIIMCSKEGELLLEYIENLEHQNKKQKEVIDKAIEYISNKKAIINTDVIRIFDLFKIDEQGYTDKLLDILKEVSK